MLLYRFRFRLGHYLYSQAIDSSSSSLSKLQTAWYDTSSFTCFLSFAYNLHGPYVGEIAVFIETFTARLNAWSEKGNKGIAWQTTEIYLGHFTSQFRISILAIHDSRSDDILALDDITFNDCNCKTNKVVAALVITDMSPRLR